MFAKNKRFSWVLTAVIAVFAVSASLLIGTGALTNTVSDDNSANYNNTAYNTATANGEKDFEANGNVFAPEIVTESGTDYVVIEGDKIEIKETSEENKRLLEEAGAIPRTVEFKKDGVPEFKCLINGSESVFAYDKSQKTIIPDSLSLDGEELCIVLDYYVNEKGYSAIKYEGSEFLKKFGTNFFGSVEGEVISLAEAEIAALNIASNTDLGVTDLKNAKVSSRNGGGNRYQVTLDTSDGTVIVALDFTGGLQWISAEINAAGILDSGRKATAEAKMQTKLDALKNANPNAKIELTNTTFELCGEGILTKFTVAFYPYPDSDACSMYQYFCFA